MAGGFPSFVPLSRSSGVVTRYGVGEAADDDGTSVGRMVMWKAHGCGAAAWMSSSVAGTKPRGTEKPIVVFDAVPGSRSQPASSWHPVTMIPVASANVALK